MPQSFVYVYNALTALPNGGMMVRIDSARNLYLCSSFQQSVGPCWYVFCVWYFITHFGVR